MPLSLYVGRDRAESTVLPYLEAAAEMARTCGRALMNGAILVQRKAAFYAITKREPGG